VPRARRERAGRRRRLEASIRFYRDGLGLPTRGIIGREFEYGAVAFFDPRGGLTLAAQPPRLGQRRTALDQAPAVRCEGCGALRRREERGGRRAEN